ncbi:hypothetical protein ACE6H2_016532 [Prunus campanulata]
MLTKVTQMELSWASFMRIVESSFLVIRRLDHVPRSCNEVAHRLARYALTCGQDYVWVEEPPRSCNEVAHRLARYALTCGQDYVWVEEPLVLIHDILFQYCTHI